MQRIEVLQKAIKEETKLLNTHKLYSKLNSIEDIKVFMENHVFAVWDFMSLLKSLQQSLTCVEVPWIPKSNPETSRFINEIVHGEESDLNINGVPQSHFEMYLDAMEEIGASTLEVQTFIAKLKAGESVNQALKHLSVCSATKEFVAFTFNIIQTGQPHLVASAFTFGREDIIPDMFLAILNEAETKGNKYDKLRYYLERHIELDGDEHGPLSLKMMNLLCEEDDQKWKDAQNVAVESVKMRNHLWAGIADVLPSDKAVSSLR